MFEDMYIVLRDTLPMLISMDCGRVWKVFMSEGDLLVTRRMSEDASQTLEF
jgi:hypothetical protein